MLVVILLLWSLVVRESELLIKYCCRRSESHLVSAKSKNSLPNTIDRKRSDSELNPDPIMLKIRVVVEQLILRISRTCG